MVTGDGGIRAVKVARNQALWREVKHIRSSPVRFPIKPGHDYPEFETVVEENQHHVVVQKRGKAAEVSAALDPRNRS
jgi:hypothetical protein